LWQAMHHDKKWRDGLARFVLLEDIGRPVVRDDVSSDHVMAVLQSLNETSS
jgi:3-dehydroquinate synthetase